MNYVGVDIGCTKMYIYSKINGDIFEKKAKTGLDCTKEKIRDEINEFIRQLPVFPDAVGIALPGLIENNVRVKLSDISSLNNVKADFFGQGMFIVKFINDVKAATLAEAENYKDSDTIVVIMAGSGIAAGVYSKGRIFNGANDFAGELGYCIINTDEGPQTVDSLSGGLSILRKAKCSIEDFLIKVNDNNKDALNLLESAGYYFGFVLVNMLHLFNPEIIVVGGSTSTYKGYMEKALETAKQYAIPEIFNSCRIVKAKDSKRIVALGAIEFMKQQ